MRYIPLEFQPIILWLRATVDRVKDDEGGYSPVTKMGCGVSSSWKTWL